jgi:DNA polymerase-4
LRDAGLHASTVTLTLRFTDFRTITRSHTLAEPCDLDSMLLGVIRELFSGAWNGVAMLRLVGVGLSGFTAGSGQLDLLDPGRREKLERLARTTDRLRDRFGFSKVQLGGSLETRKHGGPDTH